MTTITQEDRCFRIAKRDSHAPPGRRWPSACGSCCWRWCSAVSSLRLLTGENPITVYKRHVSRAPSALPAQQLGDRRRTRPSLLGIVIWP